MAALAFPMPQDAVDHPRLGNKGGDLHPGAALADKRVRRAMVLVTIGILSGLVATLGLSRILTSMLFEVKPTDASTLAMMAALFWLAGLLACYLPARRAAKVDPATVLKVC